MEFSHYSVLLKESIEHLITNPDGIYVDGTLGGGGHSLEICKHLSPKGRLIGFDQDEAAIKAASEHLEFYRERVTIIRSNYCQMKTELQQQGITGVDGILLDLGVSSYQLDEPERGFTYREEDAYLDMRMDRRQTKTAADILAKYSEMDLFHIIRNYGEDKFAKNIAKHIVRARAIEPIRTAGQLNEIIRAAIPVKERKNGHPSKKTFQAIRIEVNRELDVLRESIDEMIELLNPNGRLCIITFHSLEDRIVKQHFKTAENPCTCPREFPVCICGKVSKGTVISKKPILPSLEELEVNKRSKSAKLRVFERGH